MKRKVQFTFGCAPEGTPAGLYDGFTDDTTWNGFTNVWVSPETAEAIAKWAEVEDCDDTAAELRAQAPDADGLISLANGYTPDLTTLTRERPAYLVEFPDFDHEVPDCLGAWGFTDESWHNDVCPSFFHAGASLTLWIDYLDPTLREMDGKTFCLVRLDEDRNRVGEPLAETDDFDEVRAAFLADRFAQVLRRWLTDEQWATMRRRNATIGNGLCASHDFCDANMAMDEAFTVIMGREINLEDEHGDNALWNSAWDIAHKRYLTAA